MDSKDYESTTFYSRKYRNFSTMIIIPAAILVLILFIGSFLTMRQNTVSSVGVIEPKQVISLTNSGYQEGQIINKNKQKWQVHLDEKKANLVHLMPLISGSNKVNILMYLPGNKIAAIKKGQQVHFQTENSSGTADRVTGKVSSVGVYPVNVRNSNLYEVVCEAKVSPKINIKYGMEGDATIITGESTYFEYFRDKVLNKR